METVKDKKIEYIEWLRIVCAFAVVGIHITMTQPNNYSVAEIGAGNYMILTSVYALVQWAVPVFLMISGNLLLHSNRISLDKVKTYVIRMAVVLLVFGSMFALMEQIFDERTVRPVMLFRAILLTLERKSWSHLWYLYVLIGIYLILIPLKRFIDAANKKEIYALAGVLIVGNFIIPTLNTALGLNIDTFMVFTQYVTYFILGYIISDLPKFSGSTVCIITFALATIVKMMIQCITVLRTGAGAPLFLGDRLFTLIQAVAIYMFFKQLMDKKHVGCFAKSISRCSFGIYLIHPFFINLLYKLLNVTPTNFLIIGISIPLLWVSVFIVSWLAAWIMTKIPMLKRII